jgi:hypothetical protein
MTWVVGASTLFGYGVLVSDIQVTDKITGYRMDILQKAFPVGKYIVAGMAGDVRAGLILLSDLSKFLNSVNVLEDECWDPEWVTNHWPEQARNVYRDLLSDNSIGETHIIMVGLNPEGTPDRRVLGGAVGHISVMRSPDFCPESQKGGRKAMSIGCGSEVELYTDTLKHLMLDTDLVYMKSEIGSIGGYGRCIGHILKILAEKNPIDGISNHFHLFLIRMGEIKQWSSPGMPKVARTLPELVKMVGDRMNSNALVAPNTLTKS